MEYKWKAFSVTSIGSMMAGIDGTTVLLALLPIARDLSASYIAIIWVIIAYLLAMTALVLSLGRISDIYGRKRMYNLGFVVFTVGSALCGFSPDANFLIAFRVIQGVGAAMLTANSLAILAEAFPSNERGIAFGSTAIIWGVGSVIGIILGGLIVAFTTWRVIFWINVPIGIIGTVWAYRVLRESKSPTAQGESFDLPAAALFTGAVTSLLVGVTWGLLYGWTNASTLVAFALVLPLFTAFVFWETRVSQQPIVDFGFFRKRTFTFGTVAAMLQSIAIFSVNFLLVFYLEGIYGLSVLTASYLIIPYAAAAAIVGPFGGRLTDRFGARRVATIGLALQIVALVAFSQLATNTPIYVLGVIEAVFGIGGGMFFPANTSMVMSDAPRGRYGIASGVLNTLRNTGAVLSFAVSLIAVTAAVPAAIAYALFLGTFKGHLPASVASAYLSGQSLAFLISAGLLVASLVLIRLTVSRGPRESAPFETAAPSPEAG